MAQTYTNSSYEKDQLDHNTKWCDIPVNQVFQFDHQPSNVIQVGTSRDYGVGPDATTNGWYNNLYEMTRRLQNKNLGGWQRWMNWIQKIQPDYKFLTVNQTNGQTCVFANVDDPWMFTQYIYQGIGKYYNPQAQQGSNKAVQAQYAVIQPATYNWEDLTPKNKQAKQRDLLQKGQTDTEENKYVCYHRVNPKGWYKKQFGQYEYKRYTTGADGCDIYRTDILVQCVKWGQHGNIPPHVLNCMAPAKYLQSATKMTLKTINKPTVGIPLYSDKNGVFQKKDNKLYIHSISFSDHQFEDPQNEDPQNEDPQNEDPQNEGSQNEDPQNDGNSEQLPKFFGKIDKDGQPIETPQSKRTQYGTVRLISTQRQTGELLYNGCKYFKKLSDKYYGCSLDNDFTQQQRNKAYCSVDGSDSCLTKNTKCKYFTKSFNLNIGTVIVARYQIYQKRFVDTGDDQIQKAQNQLKQIAAASIIAGGVLAEDIAFEAYGNSLRKNLSTDGSEITIKYQTSYQIVQQPVNGIQVYIPPNAQNYKGAIVTRGTGQSAFDYPALPVRNIYNNDISPINFTRWLNQILPCYQRKFCNDTIGLNNSKKRNGYCNCGIPYKDIAKNTNQIVTKNSGFCPYYTQANKKNMGCPYNAVNKGALDFALHNNLMYQNLFLKIALPIATKFALNKQVTTYQTDQIIAQYSQNIVTIYYKDVGSYKRNFVNDDIAVIYLSKSYGIQQQVLLDNHSDGKWLLCKVKFQKQENGGIKKINDILQCWMYVKYWPYDYGSYTDGRNASRLKSNGSNVQWIIKVQNYDVPTRDPMFVDNQMKFVGGYHPQYMQYPASPDQILYKKQQPYDQQDTLQSKADSSQFGQASLAATKQVQYGYFVLQTGNWVLDGGSIGDLIGQSDLISELDVRAQNPVSSFHGGIALHDRWTNSYIDPQKGTENKKIVNCLVFSNDTKASIQQLMKKPPQIVPQDAEKAKKIPPRVLYPQYLPRQRTGCFCSQCKTVLALRFYQFDKQVTRCPWCGNPFVKQKPMEYFPRTKAMGRASVWGLPGTLIKTDTYFWKSQVHVTNALIDQMCFKLGVANSQGGGYKKTSDGSESQKIDRVPYNESTGVYTMNLTSDLVKYISSVSSVNNSSLYTQKNLVMVNPNMPKRVVKYGVDNNANKFADNRIINPFTTDFNGLKMVTADYMVAFRNRLQPTFAYMIGKTPSASSLAHATNITSQGQHLSSYAQDPSQPDQYQMYRVSYSDRKQLSFLKKWIKRKSVVNNVVLAYAGDAQHQAQAFVQFPVGSQQQWYWAKKYYPPDPHWWYNKGYVGGIVTNLSGNVCHIDKPTSIFPSYRWNKYSNLQKNLQSSVFLCPHGYVPGDKIVKAAYVIWPGSQLSCDEDPIGQFQIPGINFTRVAYNHYHSFTRCDIHQHNDQTPQGRQGHVHADSGNFANGDKESYVIPNEKVKYTQVCSDSKVVSFYIDKYGDKFYIDQKSGLPMYQRQYKQLYKEKFLTKTQDIHLNGWHVQNVPYIPSMVQINIDSVLSGIAHSRDTHLGQNPKGYGEVPVRCIQWGGFGTDIIQKQTENSIWKQYTTQEFQEYQDLYSFQVEYTIDFGGGNVQKTAAPKYASSFNNFISQQMQPIPGYFNMSGINSSKLMKKRQRVKQVDTADIQGQYQDFIIVQASGGNNGNNNEYQTQAGQADHADDITGDFKGLYYNRISRSYTAQTGKKGLDDLKILQASQWTGVLSNPQSDDMKKYNDRILTTDGYVLNANYWLPKTQQSNSAISATEYEKIQMQQNKIYFTTKKQQYYNMSPQDTVTVTITKTEIKNGQQITNEEEYTCKILTGELIEDDEENDDEENNGEENNDEENDDEENDDEEESKLVDVSVIVSALKQCHVTNISTVQSNIVIDADPSVQYQIEFNITDQNSSIQFECTPAGSNRIVSYTGYSGIYHPYFLTNYYPSQNLRPWKTSGSQDSVQTCIIDLYHTPRQKERRDYRVQEGHMDYTNAKCKNSDCQAGKSGSPIAIYAKNNGISFSQLSDKCPFCSQKLSGGSMVDGDGIKTYIYDDLFQTDQIIRQLQIKLTQSSNDVICPFAIYVSSNLNDWECIFSGLPNGSTNYSYSSLYIKKDEESEDQKQESLVTASANSNLLIKLANLVRGRYLKISVSPVPTNEIITLNTLINNIKNGYISFQDSLENIDDGGLKNCFCKVYLSRRTENTTIQHSFNLNIVNNSKGKLYFNTELIKTTDTINSIIIQAKIYKTCFNSIKVGGVSYSQKQITIMPKPTTLTYDYDSSGISLNYLPIQFFKVSALINDSCQIILQQVQNYDKIDTDDGLRFFVQIVTENFRVIKRDDAGNAVLDQSGKIQIEDRAIKYYRIKSGRFYFDVAKKKIILPRYYYSQQNILQVPFGITGAAKPSPPIQNIKKPTGTNQDDPNYNPNYNVTTSYYKFSKSQLTENLTKWGITKRMLPTKMHAVLWSGMQGGVDLKIDADGIGPSYQVEKGSICFIDTKKYQKGGQCDNGLSTPLPDTTSSYLNARDINIKTTKRQIPWIVYNSQVITMQNPNNVIGSSGKFVVSTTATQRTELGQDWFVSNIMGTHCQKAYGKCSGYITLKGRPNTVIYGQLKVHAAAVTKRNFCGDIYSYQLTGGFSKQGILLTPTIKKSGGGGRYAVGYYIPYILVYLAQYSPLGTTEPQFANGNYQNAIQVVGT